MVGASVRALYPNDRWGVGVVAADTADTVRGLKPLTVRRSDGSVGYFHYSQIERVAPAAIE